MKKIILTTIFLLFSFLHLNAQQVPTITTGQISGVVCKGDTISVPFTSTGSFDADNTFKVQIRGSQQWIDLATEGTSSPLKAIIPLSYFTRENSNDNQQSIRVIATKPNIIGRESGFNTIYSKPNITLSGASILDISPYTSTVLKFKGSGSTPITIVLIDSTKLSINYLESNFESNDPFNASIYPTKSTNYKIAYTENICGRSNGSGNVSITVNEIGLKALEPNVTKICVGNVLKIPYSASGKINSDNQFKIKLSSSNDKTEIYEIDAVAKDNIIEAIIPEKIPQGTYYSLQIISSSPKASSIWYDFNILITEKANVEIAQENIDVIWGDKVNLNFTVKGLGPWIVKMNDGTNIPLRMFDYTSPNSTLKQNFQIKPDKSQNYSITSFISGCGSGIGGQNITSLTVKPGVVLDSIQQFKEICVGETISAKFRINSSLLNPNSFKAVLNDFNNHTVILPASFNDGLLKLVIPKTLLDINDFNLTYRLGISFNNDKNIAYSPNSIQIKNKPKATLLDADPFELEEPGIVYIPVKATGSGIMTFVFNDSINIEDRSYPGYALNSDIPVIDVNVIKNTTFKLTSVSNLCGTTYINENKKIDVIIKNPKKNDITIKYVNNQICAGDKIKVLIDTLGKFQDNNEFKVLFYVGMYNRNFTVIGTGKGKSVEATIPSNLAGSTSAYYIEVVSTNPVLASRKRNIMINAKPNAKLLSYSTLQNNEAVLLAGESINTYLSVDNSILHDGTYSNYGYSFSDGTNGYGRGKSFYPTFTKSNTYSLLSISNECGNGTVSNDIKIKIVPFKIIRNSNSLQSPTPPLSICSGANLTYSYSILGGVENGTTYNLQIASAKDSVFTDLVSKTSENPINVKIPSQTKEGIYFIRLVSNTNEPQSSSWTKYNIYVLNNVNLTTVLSHDTITEYGGNEVKFKYQSKTATPTNIIIADNFGKVYSYNSQSLENTISIIPQKSATFSIKSVENVCGYGTASGSVKVTIIPALVIQSTGSLNGCNGKEIEIKYSPVGEYEAGNTFKFSFVNKSKPNIKYEAGQTSNASGNIKLKIPSDALFGSYQLEVISSKPALTKTYTDNIFNIFTTSDITITGNTIINAGQTAYFKLTNNSLKSSALSSLDAGNYELSDGTKGDFYYYENIVAVRPSQTTTYTLTSANNTCGLSKISGNVTITVNPISSKSISTEFYSNYGNPYICPGANYNLYYYTNGNFASGTKFSAQISDKNGENFVDLKMQGTSSPLLVTIPVDLPTGNNYRFRVVSTEKDVSSSANSSPLNVMISPTVSFDSLVYMSDSKPINLKFDFNGTPPWFFRFGMNQSTTQSYRIETSPFMITVTPQTSVSYKIYDLNDAYCFGKVLGTGIVRIELITANEDPKDLNITLFPNPTPNFVTIRSDYFKNTRLKIVDSLGKDILEQDLVKSETVLDFSGFTTGLYFLQFNRDNKRVVYKIQKL
ncbi:T9SS type A sorting domain-containing protein [Arcicella lustrica]|uniref:T9SS type A sorting domain-containing protein n=1 Tax=Arcicella lustrica TaxID=2984196 RepID=A0ABU5SNI8_9BACT|nr:T9SS type A sorting domain-containing protein [Arcicella sp. DC25W]MEA5428866.1 T9SS type A sorting domain-containing protein [Arcicella sp. DC25W]